MKTIEVFFLLAFIASMFIQCKSKSDDDLCVANPIADCICITLYDPVCGCDDVTYGNSCEAACNSVEVAHQGPCN